jgi:FAD:protein FMN transferase
VHEKQQQFAMLNRRQLLSAAGAVLVPVGCTRASTRAQVWESEALGAPARIELFGLNGRAAADAFLQATQMIEQLSNSFSLYREDSEISRLNRDGRLDQASPAMVELVTLGQRLGVLTDGAFDMTVQVLWQAARLLQEKPLSAKAEQQQWQAAYERVDYRKVRIEGTQIEFALPGMAITLNGIAQGYITGRVAQLLERLGARAGLVNIGEFQAFGERAFWVGIQDPGNVLDVLETVRLKQAGLATSSALGGVFGGGVLGQKRFHIFNPESPKARARFVSASVVHASAAMADGLATAFTLMDEAAVRDLAKALNVEQVILVDEDGKTISF